MNDLLISKIKEIISDVEEIQRSHESSYTKEQAKLSAYDAIVELIGDDMKFME